MNTLDSVTLGELRHELRHLDLRHRPAYPVTGEERIHASLLAALHTHRARTGEITDPHRLAAHLMEAVSDDLVKLAQSEAPMVCDHEGHMIPHTANCPERSAMTHDYLSTGCLHGEMTLPDGRTGHEYCQGETGHLGAKQPARCKFCGAPCQCDCHILDRKEAA